jgi:hypothetical protein
MSHSDSDPARAPAAPLACIEGPAGCRGAVLLRWPGYGGRSWPRCGHGDERVRREQAAIRRYPEHGPPAGFDPLDAGESWHPDE